METSYLHAILYGVLLGIISAVLGWVKNAKPGKFTFRGLLFKLPAGVVVGIIASMQSIEFNDALQWATGVGLVEVLDKVTKVIIRRFRPDWGKMGDSDYSLEFDPKAAEAMMKLSVGKNLTRDDIIYCTESFRQISEKLLDMNDPLDREFKEHLDFAFNQILQNVRKDGWSAETYEVAGKILFRLFQVWRKYRSDKTSLSAKEWANEIKFIVKLLQAAFKGSK